MKRYITVLFVVFMLAVGVSVLFAQTVEDGASSEKREVATETQSNQEIKNEEKETKTFEKVSQHPVIPEAFRELSENKEWEISKLELPWLVEDNNDDRRGDSALLVQGSRFTKNQEGIDSNYDGFIDDFAFFDTDGNLVYQEIDSNYDRKIDLWVEVGQGNRIKRIQRDIDYDGIVDRDLAY